MLTKDRVKTIHADIQAALRQVAEKHGLTVSAQSKVTFGSTTFKFSTEFGLKDANGAGIEVDPKLARNAERFGGWQGLGAASLGKTFTDTRLGVVTYVGMTSRDKAIVKASDGRMYRYEASVVAKHLK